MSEPLVNDIARRVLQLIADAWDVPLEHLAYQHQGPSEMAHHFLKIELTLTYAQVAGLLETYDTSAQHAVRRGEKFYTTWPVYQQRYVIVRDQVLRMFQFSQPGQSHTS